MANETISTSIDELSAIMIAEARLVMANRQDLRKICTKRPVGEGNISVRFPKYANQAAAAQGSEGQEVANSEVTTTGVVLTPAINAAWSTVVGDLAKHNAPQVMADLGRLAGDAIIKKLNADIFALFDGFSVSIGTTNTDLTMAVVRLGLKKLQQASAHGPVYFVMTPEVWEDILADLATYNGANVMLSDTMRDAINRGLIDPQISLYGVSPIVVTSGISEATDVKCGLLTQGALGYAEAWDIKVVAQERGKVVGTEVTASAAYAVGEIEDAFGIEVIADGAD